MIKLMLFIFRTMDSISAARNTSTPLSRLAARGALNQRQSLVKHKHHNRYIQNVRDLQHHQIPADDRAVWRA